MLHTYSLFTTLLALCVMLFGAYTRLTDAGLGCPDWPACYGQWIVSRHLDKALTEMIHRYLAGFLGICSLGLILAFIKQQPRKRIFAFLLFITLLFQAGLGRWTVTLKLWPPVVMGHLLGGMLTLSLLWIMTLSLGNNEKNTCTAAQTTLCTASLLMLILQIALGAWLSADYAALVCPDLLTCHPEVSIVDWSPKMTMHMLHRLGALLSTALIMTFALSIKKQSPRLAYGLITLLILQITLGLLNVLWILPLPIAIAHQGIASLLLLTVISCKILLRGDVRVFRDYLTLCKPRVVLLMLLTAWVGMRLAASFNHQPFVISDALIAAVGIACCSAGAAVLNHLIDQQWDAKMQRTQHRPLVQHRISNQAALIFALCLSLLGFGLLHTCINPLTALLTLCAYLGYAAIYSVGLKHRTPQNIVIGGAAGALPPLLGWTALCGEIQALAWLPVLIIFAWTPPHFWALAIARISDYQKAQVPMLPITHGVAYTTLSMVLYSILLLMLSLLPTLSGLCGPYYFAAALILGLLFLAQVIRLHQKPTSAGAAQTFRFSIIYLLLLFTALLIDCQLRS
jgi:protoheme IX farnesyltransferase